MLARPDVGGVTRRKGFSMSQPLTPRRATTEQQAGLDRLDGYPHRWFGALPGEAPDEDPPDTFPAALADLALTVNQEGVTDDQRALDVIVEGAVAIISGVEHAAVVVRAGPQRLDARAVHGELPPAIMQLQNNLGEGPCLDALQDTSQLLIADIVHDARWPRFAAEAGQLGVRSMLCTPLAARDTIVGLLSVASTEPDAFDEESMAMVAVFAAHATVALLGVHQVRNLTALAGTRDLIGQAKGILMERYRLSSDAAFQMLVRISQNGNIPLRQVCSALAETGEIVPPDRKQRP